MIYLISESQQKVLLESDFRNFIRRRANPETMTKFVRANMVADDSGICEEFMDEYEFADTVLDGAVDDMLAEFSGSYVDHPDYNDILDELNMIFREKYREDLIDIYNHHCYE